MPRSELQLSIGRLQFVFAQSEAGHGRAVLRVQVRFVRFVAGISRHPVLLGREWVDNAGLKPRLGKGPLHRQVVVTSPFHDDDRVADIVLLLGLADQVHRRAEAAGPVRERLGLDEQVAEVVGHHPLTAVLGRIDAHDGKPFAPYLLDTGANDTIGLLQRLSPRRTRLAISAAVYPDVVRHLDSP